MNKIVYKEKNNIPSAAVMLENDRKSGFTLLLYYELPEAIWLLVFYNGEFKQMY